jgi:hypothetical protein
MAIFRSCLVAFALAFAASTGAAASWIVAVELDGKTVFQDTIRTLERDTVAETWNDLLSYALKPTKDAKDVPEAGKGDRIALKGKIVVHILPVESSKRANRITGSAELTELSLDRAKFVPGQWIIAPADATRIVELRKMPEQKDSPK